MPVQTLGEGEGSPKTTRVGMATAIFFARCFWAKGVFLGGKSHDHRRFFVAFEKEVSLKSIILFTKLIVRQYCSFKLEKKNI